MRRTRSGLNESLQQAEAAEDQHRRLCRLFGMDEAELRRRLAAGPAEAAPWVESAARYGVVEAQLRLGQMRLDGAGVAKDEAAALAWFRRAARQGAPEAMNMVGRCYENGWGVDADLEAAAHWFRQSAEAGHDWGQYNLGHLFFDGRGARLDRAEAFLWYRRAGEQGHGRAMNLVGRCCEEGWGVPRDPALAETWYRRSAQVGYFRGQYNYASCLAARGDVTEALSWLEAACAAAPSESLTVMSRELARQSDPRLATLGRRFSHKPAGLDRAEQGAPS